MASAAAAVVIRQNKIRAMNAYGPVLAVTKEEFEKVIANSPDVFVVRTEIQKLFSGHHKLWRYLTSSKGITFFCETEPEVNIPDIISVIDCEEIKVPQDL